MTGYKCRCKAALSKPKGIDYMKINSEIKSSGVTSKKLKNIRRDTVAWLMILPSIFCLYFFVWRPIFIGTSYSLFELKGFEIVKFVGLKNYKVILTNAQFLKTLLNTLKYVLFYIIFGYLPPILVAIMLNELRIGRKSLKFMIYFPTIVPGIVTYMIWKLMYRPDMGGLLNGLLSYMGISPKMWLNSAATVIPCIVFSSAWNGLGGNMIYYFAALQGVNSELYEAAVIDGAGVFKRVYYITLPQISGVMLLFFVRSVISVFQIMEAPLVMTDGGPNGASLTLGLQAYRYAFENYQLSYSLALGVVQFFMLIGLTVFYFKMQNKIEIE